MTGLADYRGGAPLGPDRATCRSAACGAEILWVTTARGRRIPLDPDPVPLQRGALVFVEDDVVRGAHADDAGPFFLAHFTTCPAADDFLRGS